MLGIREKNIYGPMKLEDIHGQMKSFADQNKLHIQRTCNLTLIHLRNNMSIDHGSLYRFVSK